MTAREYIDKNLQPLPPDATVEKSVLYFLESKLNESFIFNDFQELFLLKLEDIIFTDKALPALPFSTPFAMKITDDVHWSKLLAIFKMLNREVLPVFNLNFAFEGLISKSRLIEVLPDLNVLEEAGAILILECEQNFYAASEVVRISEMYNARVITLLTHQQSETGKFIITLKINLQETGGIISTYERFGYDVTHVFMNKDFEKDVYTERYESLLKTLDL